MSLFFNPNDMPPSSKPRSGSRALDRILARNPEAVYAFEYDSTTVGDHIDRVLGQVCRLLGLDKVGKWLASEAFPDQSKPDPRLKKRELQSTGRTLKKHAKFYTTHQPQAESGKIITRIK